MARKCPVGSVKVRNKCVRVRMPTAMQSLHGFAAADTVTQPPYGYMVLARVQGTSKIAATVSKRGAFGLPGVKHPTVQGVPTGLHLINVGDLIEKGVAAEGWTLSGGKLDFVGRYRDKAKVWALYVLRGGVAVPTGGSIASLRVFEVINHGPQFFGGDASYVHALEELEAIGQAEARSTKDRIVMPVMPNRSIAPERTPNREMAQEAEAIRRYEGEDEENTSLDVSRREESEDPAMVVARERSKGRVREEVDPADDAREVPVGLRPDYELSSEDEDEVKPARAMFIPSVTARGDLKPKTMRYPGGRTKRVFSTEGQLEYRTRVIPTEKVSSEFVEVGSPRYLELRERERAAIERQRAEERARQEAQGEEWMRAIERDPAFLEQQMKAKLRQEKRGGAAPAIEEQAASRFDKTDFTRKDFFRIYPDEFTKDEKVKDAPYLVYWASPRFPMPLYLRRGPHRYTKVEVLPQGKVTYRRDDVKPGTPFSGVGRQSRGMRSRLAGLGIAEDDDDGGVAPMVRRAGVVLKKAETPVSLVPVSPPVSPVPSPVVVQSGTIAPIRVVGGPAVKKARYVTAEDMKWYKVPGREIAGRQIVRVYRGDAPFKFPLEFTDMTADGMRLLRFKRIESDERAEDGTPLILYAAQNPNVEVAAPKRPYVDQLAPSKREVRVLEYPDQITFDVNKRNIAERPKVTVVRAHAEGRAIIDMEEPWEMAAPFTSELVLKAPGLLSLSDRAGTVRPFAVDSGAFLHRRLSRTISFDGMSALGRVRATLNVADIRSMDLLRPSVPVRWGRKTVDSDGVFKFSYELARDLQAWMGKLANERLGKLSGLWPEPDMLAKTLPPMPVTQFPAGTVLFHGTNERRVDTLRAGHPMSVTTSKDHAQFYAETEHGGDDVRVLEFALKVPLTNILEFPATSSRSFNHALYWLNEHTGQRRLFRDLGMGRPEPEAWAELVSRGYNGIYIRHINSGGDELVLFHPERVLTLVQTHRA